MAFPGDRLWKMALTIPHEMIFDDIVNDGLFRKTHVDLPTNFLTLGHAQAPQDGGTDIAASLDELGETRIPCYVVRCDLDSTPANSRVHIWFRRQDVSDTNDTVIWLWWGSETETAPAVDEDYGRNDVFDGTTGTGAPVAAWGVWLYDEDPTDPSPCYTDVTGNGHGANDNGTVTRVDSMDARGIQLTAGSGWVTTGYTWAPGTADFSILWAGVLGTGGRFQIRGSDILDIASEGEAQVKLGGSYCTGPAAGTGAAGFAIARDGATMAVYANTSSGGWGDWTSADVSFDSTIELASRYGCVGTVQNTCTAFLDTAVNAYWFRAWRDCLVSESTFWEVGEITAAAVQAVLTVSPIAVGSEVRYYEQPHPQAWTIDFAGLDVAEQDGTYFLFQVMGSGGASDHYAWFDLDDGSTDPAVADRTGHEIDVATGDTDEDIAVAAATVLNAIADLTVTIVGTVVTVTNERDGELEPPADAAGAAATGAEVSLVVVGGASTEEITGIEESTATAWGGIVSVTRPREITIVIIRPGYEPIRLEGYVAQPASALVPVSQRVDLNYSNPA